METDVFILPLSSDAVAVTCIVAIVAGKGSGRCTPDLLCNSHAREDVKTRHT